jgi:Uma2 family endonuclease
MELRTFLYRVLKLAFADRAGLGSDCFVYWHGSNPRRCLAPDVFVHLGAPHVGVKSWKTWERGTPQLAVEIVSDPGTEIEDWDDKLHRYHELGVQELVRFDPDAPAGSRLRVWDRIADDLVERAVSDDRSACLPLGLHWVVAPIEEWPTGLRLARDEAGADLLPVPEEAARRAQAEAQRGQAEAQRGQAEAQRGQAEAQREAEAARAKVAELEALLGAARGPAPRRAKKRPPR